MSVKFIEIDSSLLEIGPTAPIASKVAPCGASSPDGLKLLLIPGYIGAIVMVRDMMRARHNDVQEALRHRGRAEYGHLFVDGSPCAGLDEHTVAEVCKI